jgi:hypothetical protein
MKLRYLLGLAVCLTSAISAKQKDPGPPPIVLVQKFTPEQYGVWTVDFVSTGMYWAYTNNDAGSSFGMSCTGGECVPFFNPRITCEDKSEYPTLVNAPSGAYSAIATCIPLGKVNLLVLPDANATSEAMTIGGELGIAFPMKSGQFAVSRFSLTGALRATARAQQLSRGYKAVPPSPTVKDDTRL